MRLRNTTTEKERSTHNAFARGRGVWALIACVLLILPFGTASAASPGMQTVACGSYFDLLPDPLFTSGGRTYGLEEFSSLAGNDLTRVHAGVFSFVLPFEIAIVLPLCVLSFLIGLGVLVRHRECMRAQHRKALDRAQALSAGEYPPDLP
jgi:hypothetical protein